MHRLTPGSDQIRGNVHYYIQARRDRGRGGSGLQARRDRGRGGSGLLNEIDKEQVHKYAPTDTRFRPDQR